LANHVVLPAPAVIVSRPSLDRLAIWHLRVAANLTQSLAIGQALANLVEISSVNVLGLPIVSSL
jgi:hypothetical protein